MQVAQTKAQTEVGIESLCSGPHTVQMTFWCKTVKQVQTWALQAAAVLDCGHRFGHYWFGFTPGVRLAFHALLARKILDLSQMI